MFVVCICITCLVAFAFCLLVFWFICIVYLDCFVVAIIVTCFDSSTTVTLWLADG